jgi:hypothetical protein
MSTTNRLVDPADLIASGDIATLAGVKLDTVMKWAVRHGDFPKPLATTSAGHIYSRVEVSVWLLAHGRSSA